MLDSLFIGSFIAESWADYLFGMFRDLYWLRGLIATGHSFDVVPSETSLYIVIVLRYSLLRLTHFDSDTSFYIYMSPAPGGINSSLSGAPCPPGGRLPRPLRGLPLPGNGPIPGPKPGPTGSNRAPGGAPIGGR